MSTWVIVFNSELNFKFSPVKITDDKVDVDISPFIANNNGYLFVIENPKNNYHSAPTYYIINTKGEIIYTDKISRKTDLAIEFSPVIIRPDNLNNNQLKLIDHEGNIYTLDDTFKLRLIKKVPNFKYPYFRGTMDINGDGNSEYIFKLGRDNSYIIADHSFKYLARFTLLTNSTMFGNISVNLQIDKRSELIIQNGVNLFHIPYYQNPLWNFRFFIYAFIFFAIYGLLWIIQYIQKENIKRQLFTKQQIKELQFKVVTAQLNPHFTFNALNSLSHAVYNPEKPELYDRFTNFSRLIRTMLTDTDKNYRTLEDEIKLTRDFLEIQKFRFKNAFDYTFNLVDDIDLKILVPKLIIQLFVENAIKHAFPNHKGKDHITIMVKNKTKLIHIEISDNGIGRKEAAKRQELHPEKSTGIGLKVMHEFIQLLNQSNKNKLKFSIQDINDNSVAAVTKVIISIPKNFQY